MMADLQTWLMFLYFLLPFSLDQNGAAQLPSVNSTAASFKSLLTNTTGNAADVNVTSAAPVNGSVAEVKTSDSSATVEKTDTAEPALVDLLADRFLLVYSAREAFSVQNLSAAEMFQVLF